MLWLTFGSLLSCFSREVVAAATIGTELHKRRTCEVAEVQPYAGTCGAPGWVQVPVYAARLNSIATLKDCAAECLKTDACRSFRFRQDASKCYLYKKYITQMLFTTENYRPGRYYDAACFSNDCDVIDACRAIAACENIDVYEGVPAWAYSKYACGFQTQSNFEQKLGVKPLTYHYSGNLSACDVVSKCARATPPNVNNPKSPNGPFDLLFRTNSKTSYWQCNTYDMGVQQDYPKRKDATKFEQHINEKTFSVPNEKAGASYGYWESFFSYET